MGSDGPGGRNELDSHADTSAGGSNVILLGEAVSFVSVTPFKESYEPIENVPVGTCATAYTNLDDGRTCILLYGQMLYFGDSLSASLICPNQVRDNGNLVDDCPRQYSSSSKHGLTLQNDEEGAMDLFVPLEMDGVISYFESRKPTQDEIDNCDHYWMTSEVEWNPHAARFAEDEDAMNDAVPQEEVKISAMKKVKKVSFTIPLVDEIPGTGNGEPEGDPDGEPLGLDDGPNDGGRYELLRLQRLEEIAQPRDISVISVADDNKLVDRMLDQRNLKLSCGDNYKENHYDVQNLAFAREFENARMDSVRPTRSLNAL